MLLITRLAGQQGHLKFHLKTSVPLLTGVRGGGVGHENHLTHWAWNSEPRLSDHLAVQTTSRLFYILSCFWWNISLCSQSWSKLSFWMLPLFRSKLRQRSGAFIHQKTSGIHFIHRLLFSLSNPGRLKWFFSSCLGWEWERFLRWPEGFLID